ncbi:hypothetical protein HK104_000872, partial [Borealophlyctis nickersoniae]
MLYVACFSVLASRITDSSSDRTSLATTVLALHVILHGVRLVLSVLGLMEFAWEKCVGVVRDGSDVDRKAPKPVVVRCQRHVHEEMTDDVPDTLVIIAGLVIATIFALDITTFRTPTQAVPTALLTIYSVTVFLQLTLCVFGVPDTHRRRRIRVYARRAIVALAVVSATFIPFIVFPDLRYYFSYGLWPLGTLLVIATTGRKTNAFTFPATTRMMNPLRAAKQRARVHVEVPASSSSYSVTGGAVSAASVSRDRIRRGRSQLTEPTPTPGGRPPRGSLLMDVKTSRAGLAHLRALAGPFSAVLVSTAAVISLFNGMYLPLAFSACLVGFAYLSGYGNEVGRRGVMPQLRFWSASLVVLVGMVGVTMVVPVFGIERGGGVSGFPPGSNGTTVVWMPVGGSLEDYAADIGTVMGFGVSGAYFSVQNPENGSVENLVQLMGSTGKVLITDIGRSLGTAEAVIQ